MVAEFVGRKPCKVKYKEVHSFKANCKIFKHICFYIKLTSHIAHRKTAELSVILRSQACRIFLKPMCDRKMDVFYNETLCNRSHCFVCLFISLTGNWLNRSRLVPH